MRAIFLFLLIALAGCAAVPDPADEALIAPGVRFATPGPDALGYSIDAAQMITIRYRDQSFTFEGHLGVSPGHLILACLDGFGRRAITVTRTAQGVEVEAAPWLPSAFRPANMLADITLLYWPDEAIRQGLEGTGTTLRSDPSARSILRNGEEIVRIDYEAAGSDHWARGARLRNLVFGYELDVQSAVIQ